MGKVVQVKYDATRGRWKTYVAGKYVGSATTRKDALRIGRETEQAIIAKQQQD